MRWSGFIPKMIINVAWPFIEIAKFIDFVWSKEIHENDEEIISISKAKSSQGVSPDIRSWESMIHLIYFCAYNLWLPILCAAKNQQRSSSCVCFSQSLWLLKWSGKSFFFIFFALSAFFTFRWQMIVDLKDIESGAF